VITPALLVTVVLAGLAVTALAAVIALRRVVRVDAAEEYFGLVPGVPVDDPQGTRRGPNALDRLAGVRDSGDAPPLTSWFADLVDDVAGMRQGDDDRHALTFGDLWLGRTATEADDEQLRRAAADPEHRVVDLRLVAADVTRGRPVTLPGAGPAATGWLVCPDCWHAVLPARVVDQVLAASPQPVEHACPRHGTHLRPLPPAWELPVAAAARMAAGVPGLLRAVPLYRADAADAREHSDGGGGAVTSTVTTHWLTGSPPADAPVSMFDTGLPRWPTVALAVVSDDSRPDAADGPWIETPDAERAPAPPVAPRDGVAFARAVLAAPRGWRDRIARELPGTRHRFAIVRRGAGVGLVPSDDEVLRLALRGHHAGREIRERFTGRDGEIGTQTGTDRYRWIRIRSALREQRDQSLAVTARLPLLGELSRAYRVPAGVATWFTPPISPGRVDPAWVDATAALTHLRTLAEGGVLDWDTDYGSPPRDPDGPV
jgi:hypothetical protein